MAHAGSKLMSIFIGAGAVPVKWTVPLMDPALEESIVVFAEDGAAFGVGAVDVCVLLHPAKTIAAARSKGKVDRMDYFVGTAVAST
jgi:hypothetical protein